MVANVNSLPTRPGDLVVDPNSSTDILTNGSTFTGEWVDVANFTTICVAVATDQDGTFTIQFSPDGTNADSTLTRYYRTGQIEAPHLFTITRRYARVTFTNNSGSDQTYFRLQTLLGNRPQLNAPIDSTLAPDFDAIATRPTDYGVEATLGRRQGHEAWNKWGFNTDVDTAAPEIIASQGGAMALHTTASTYDIVSDDATDDDGNTGLNSVIVYGIDSNWDPAIEVIALDGLTPVTTTTSWISHPNRVAMFLCGSGQVNAGTITVTRTTGGATVAQMPAGLGVTQQCIFTIPQNAQFMAEWMMLSAARQASQNPFVTFKLWVYSAVNNGKQEVFRLSMETETDTFAEVKPERPFPIGEKSIIWLEATTDFNDTEVNARFSGILINDVDN